MYVFRRLDSNAVSYLRDRLLDGYTFARLLSAKRLELGELQACAPPSVNESHLGRFNEGGVLSRQESIACITRFVSTFLTQDVSHVAVFEDAWAKSQDPWLRQPGDWPYVVHGDEVLHYLRIERMATMNLLDKVQQRLAMSSVGALVKLKETASIRAGSAVGRRRLAEFADHAEHILIEAWDGEGVMVWNRAHDGAIADVK